MILVAACPRSGTRYVSHILRLSGLKIEQERLDLDGTVSWVHVGRGNVREKEVEDTNFDKIFHQVRNPLQTIASMTTISNGSRKYMRENLTMEMPEDRIKFAMAAWTGWNEKIEGLGPILRYKLEDLEEEWPTLCTLLGIDQIPFPVINEKDLPKILHSRKHRYDEYLGEEKLNWDYFKEIDPVLAVKAMEKAAEYGY
jgi:hypothetical protein